MTSTLKLVGQEITIFSKIYSVEDFKNSDNIEKIVHEFIEEAESSSSSIPVLAVLDGELKKISSENSRLIVPLHNENFNKFLSLEVEEKYLNYFFCRS